MAQSTNAPEATLCTYALQSPLRDRLTRIGSQRLQLRLQRLRRCTEPSIRIAPIAPQRRDGV